MNKFSDPKFVAKILAHQYQGATPVVFSKIADAVLSDSTSQEINEIAQHLPDHIIAFPRVDFYISSAANCRCVCVPDTNSTGIARSIHIVVH
jgi:hypothetical protein